MTANITFIMLKNVNTRLNALIVTTHVVHQTVPYGGVLCANMKRLVGAVVFKNTSVSSSHSSQKSNVKGFQLY